MLSLNMHSNCPSVIFSDFLQKLSTSILSMSGTQLHKLDISNNPMLDDRGKVYIQLHKLDISNNPMLDDRGKVYIQLHKLDISNNPMLDDRGKAKKK